MKDLKSLYALWNKLGNTPVVEDKDGRLVLDEPFVASSVTTFPRGADIESIWHWFEEQNTRFVVGEVMQGLYLTPYTVGGTGTAVYDQNGVQVCLGDTVHALVSVGYQGQMAEADFLVDDHQRLCTLYSKTADGKTALLGVQIVGDKFVLGRSSDDAKHGFQEIAIIQTEARAQQRFAPERAENTRVSERMHG